MSEADILDLLRSGIWAVVLAAAPPLLVALVVGFGISLLQALTQVQEATLSFVPKIVLILVAIVLSLPFMFHVVSGFWTEVLTHVVTPGGA
ncbi:flagellar biosynthesis protein FliQ [Niveispirillum sp. SYP-B3756]|uniref:flagellar biosynthesis protein FliQ n=1 Tax=Niveispirillum sp. SYP-B3756 TaxID=2662178 RepID=UPI001292B0D8|nr:flagellar biosynthesis protein FliQ [Niveispirillum sp. SYP-B3756]MQP67270.1 flagellar biosynthesis protein FliQ [Niveispirillum sp. SYP-B3756]